MPEQLQVPKAVGRAPAWTPGRRTDEARRRLLAGAQAAFLDKGFGGARISDITTAAGVSRATFYLYFPSKNDAFLALGTDAAASSARRWKRVKAIPTAWSEEDLRTWLTDWFDHLEQFGAFERLWRQEAPDDLKEQGLEVERRHAHRLGRELERLRGRPAGDPTLLGLAFHAMVEGLWYHYRRAPEHASRDDVLNALVDSAALFVSRSGPRA